MGTIADKLNLLLSTKDAIKNAIIAKGQSVLGTDPFSSYAAKILAIQTGLDTSDATAAAGDILSGKTAYGPSGKLTGTMAEVAQATPGISVSASGLITASAEQAAGRVAAGTKSTTKQLTIQAAATITPGTSAKTAVAAGRYTTGAVTVAGDANLAAGNIRSGVSIFGVAGSYLGNSVVTVSNQFGGSIYVYYLDDSVLTSSSVAGYLVSQGGSRTCLVKTNTLMIISIEGGTKFAMVFSDGFSNGTCSQIGLPPSFNQSSGGMYGTQAIFVKGNCTLTVQ